MYRNVRAENLSLKEKQKKKLKGSEKKDKLG